MSVAAGSINDSLESALGETPYPTFVNQVKSVIDNAKDDVAVAEVRLRTLLWQNYPWQRSKIVNTAVVALMVLISSELAR